MKINHTKVEDVIAKAKKLREIIETTENDIKTLKDESLGFTIYPKNRHSISTKLDPKTISIIRTLAIQDLEGFIKPHESELKNIFTGGIEND